MSSTVPQSTLGRDVGLVFWQIRYEQRAYWRNRGRGIFTFVFPIMFLVIFASLDKGQTISSRGNIAFNDFFVPGILAYGIIATTFVNLAIGTAILRDQGILKRMQGTPLPRWAYVLARIGSASIVMLMMTAVVLGLGVAAYGLHVRAATVPGLIVSLVLGTACFTTIGIGITQFIPNAEAGPVVLEPISRLSVTIPAECQGDVLGDLHARRARIIGTDPAADEGSQTVTATAPTAELTRYAVDLRALTGGRGSFTVTYDHYDAVPEHLLASIPAAGG